MTKTDRLDEPTKAAWSIVKDLFLAITPKAIVLAVTRCEDGLTVEDQKECLGEVNEFFEDPSFVQPNILQFKIMKDIAQ